jgi:hypothetical protein
MINELIQQNLELLTYLISIMFAILLDGLLVERGNHYIKFRFSNNQFKPTWKGYFLYVFEIIVVSFLIAKFFKSWIESLLLQYPYYTIIGALTISYIKFYYDIHKKPPWLNKLGL